MSNKPPKLAKPPRIFTEGQELRVYLDLVAVHEHYSASHKAYDMEAAYRRCLDEVRKLGIFERVIAVDSSAECDVFVTLAPMGGVDKGYGPFVAGLTRFPARGDGNRYAEIRLNEAADWTFSPRRWWQFGYKPRFERWLNHEMLHALGCSHTTDKVSLAPSILDEDNWGDNSAEIPAFDRAYVRRIYGLGDGFGGMV